MKKSRLLCSRSRLQQRFKILSDCIDDLIYHWTVCKLTWYYELGCHVKKLPFSRSVSQGWYHQNDFLKTISTELLILSSHSYFPTKLSLMVQHHKPECLVKRLDCYVQFQGYSISLIFFVPLLSLAPAIPGNDICKVSSVKSFLLGTVTALHHYNITFTYNYSVQFNC